MPKTFTQPSLCKRTKTPPFCAPPTTSQTTIAFRSDGAKLKLLIHWSEKKTGTKISWCIMTHRLVQCLTTVLVKHLLLSFSYYYHHHLIFIHRGSAVLRLISFWPTELRAKVKWRWTQLGFKERIHIWNQLWAAGPLWLKIGIFSKLIWF